MELRNKNGKCDVACMLSKKCFAVPVSPSKVNKISKGHVALNTKKPSSRVHAVDCVLQKWRTEWNYSCLLVFCLAGDM